MTQPDTLQPRYIRANGLEFAYLEAGKGPLVLVLHGFPDTAWSFVPLVEKLASAGFHAVAPFMRGYPPTGPAEDGRYSALMLGRDVIALAEHFGQQHLFVVGHDWGAVAAYAAAAFRPDRVTRVVAAGVPHLRRYLLRPSRAQLRASHYVFKFQIPLWPERRIPENDFEWLHNLVTSWSPGWTPPARYWDPVKAAFKDRKNLEAALAYYRAVPSILFKSESWRFLLRPLQVPTRVICAENDGCMLPASFEDMEHLFAEEYELIRMPGIGHFMHLEAPDEFAARTIEFVQRA